MVDPPPTFVAFDLDNTLTCIGEDVYGRTVRAWLAEGPSGGSPADAFAAYEGLRARGAALHALGLRDPNHERGNADGLAAFLLLRDGEEQVWRAAWESFCAEVAIAQAVDAAADPSAARASHEAACAVRERAEEDAALRSFAAEVRCLAATDEVQQWATKYEVIAAQMESRIDLRTPIRRLIDHGFVPAVITEGRAGVQAGKLATHELADLFEGRVLSTGAAENVLQRGTVEAAATFAESADRAADAVSLEQNPGEAWRCWYLTRLWAKKTRWFFARCVHALAADSTAPETTMRAGRFVPAEAWPAAGIRLVMIGDRLDKDVAPLQAAVGRDACLTVHLKQGKYAARRDAADGTIAAESTSAAAAAHHTFVNWDELSDFLDHELAKQLPCPILSPPACVPPGWEADFATLRAGPASTERQERREL
jgi:hypothetical protein